jgi:folate-dependent phosphoribosylglycinamide formyltransferase PurN
VVGYIPALREFFADGVACVDTTLSRKGENTSDERESTSETRGASPFLGYEQLVALTSGRSLAKVSIEHTLMRVAFIFSEYSLHNHIIERYIEHRPDDAVAIMKVPLVLKGKGRVDSASRILPKLSRRFAVGKLIEFFVVLAITLTPKILRRGAVFRRLSWIAERHGAPYQRSENVLSEESLQFLREFRPDVIVTLVHQILKGEILRMAPHGIVNIHPGLLPEFRGIQPYFWALSEGAENAGVSLHLIEDEKVDTGPLLARASFAVRRGMSVQLVYFLASICAAQMLPSVLSELSSGRTAPIPQGDGNYYGWPDSAAYDRLFARGHRLFSFVDLWRILTGRYGDFCPEERVGAGL